MKLQVGDIVMIKSEKWYYKNMNTRGYVHHKNIISDFNDSMIYYCGMKAVIVSVEDDTWSERENNKIYKLDIDMGTWHWANFMFENIKKVRRKKLKKINEEKNMLL
jgi:hypothetical protein